MRIGNYNISIRRSTPQVVDARKSIPGKTASPRKLVYGKVSRPGGTLQWNNPEFDFKLIAQCLATEAFFRRIVDKYVELVWRNGYKLTGNNDTTVKYIGDRFKHMEMATGTSTETFFRAATQQVVTYSNCFLEKVRNAKASTGRPRVTFDGRRLEPVAGYFVIDATSIKIAKLPNGKVKGYKQEIKGSGVKSPEWRPDDIVHIYKDREAGLSFGTPMVAPVMDDIRALRRMEENIEMLVFNHAMPLYLYLVGDDDNRPNGADIIKAQATVRNMPAEGMLVVPYFHEVRAIGSEGRALRCEGYLEYFKNRIFAGMGTSEVAMGYSGSASRSTAETLERGMYNTVREFQNVLRTFIEDKIISELLAEGGYGWDDANGVKFYFPEIDLDDKIKLENHILNLYSGNLITEPEARIEMGKEPILPDQRPLLYFNLVELVRALVGAVDEPFIQTLGMQAVKKMLSPHLTGRAKLSKALDMPTNQYGTKMSPGTNKDNMMDMFLDDSTDIEDGITPTAVDLHRTLNYPQYRAILRDQYNVAAGDAVRMVRMRFIDGYYEEDGEPVIESLSDYDSGNLDMVMSLTKDQMLSRSREFIMYAFNMGVQDACRQANVTSATMEYLHEEEYLRSKNDEWLSRVISVVKDLSESVMRETIYKSDAITNIMAVFDSNMFRIELGSRNELQRAYNIGTLRGGIALGYNVFQISNIDYDQDGRCEVHKDIEYSFDQSVDLDSIPPGYMTHPNCTCTIKLIR